MTSVAALTRIYPGELPYLNYFINYYFKIGIDKIYFVNTFPDNLDEITNYLSINKHFSKIEIVNLPKDQEIPLKGCQSLVLPKIKEDYTLNIDANEYLKLDDIKELCNNLNKYEIPLINFKWYMNFNDDFTFKNKNLGFKLWTKGKFIFKTEIADKIYDHMIITKNDEIDITKITNIPLIHLWCRNFNDILIKTISQRFNDLKSSNLDMVKENIKTFQLPNRLKLLSYLINLENNLVLPQFEYDIDIEKEKEILLKQLNKNEYNILFKTYLCYKFYFSCNKDTKIEPMIHDEYILNRTMELQDFNLDLSKDSNKLQLPSINNLLLQQNTDNKYILIPQKFIVDDNNINLYPSCDILLRNFENTFISNKKILVSLHPVCKLYLFYKYLINYSLSNNRILSFKEKINNCKNFNDFIINFINKIDIDKYIFTQHQIKLLSTDCKLNEHDFIIIKYDDLMNDDMTSLVNNELNIELINEVKTKMIKNKNYKTYQELKSELSQQCKDIIKCKYHLDLQSLNYSMD